MVEFAGDSSGFSWVIPTAGRTLPGYHHLGDVTLRVRPYFYGQTFVQVRQSRGWGGDTAIASGLNGT